MADSSHEALEAQIKQWLGYAGRRRAGSGGDIAEQQLRAELARLTAAGLADDEAFLVGIKRMALIDPVARQFAREHAEHLWAPPCGLRSEPSGHGAWARPDAWVAFGFAVVAGAAIKIPALFGIHPDNDAHETFYFRNASLFVLPCLTAYFVWKRRLARGTVAGLAAAFLVAGAAANLDALGGATGFEQLTALHLPIALWLAVGIAFAGGHWREVAARMNFIRFSGELFIYYVLIALGGGVLTAFMALTFQSIGIKIEPFFQAWLLPCGAAGAVVIASWLVEAKQGVMENMAPMLTRLFTPLFAAMLVAFLGTLVWSGRGINIEREMLIGFDLLLVVVLGLLVYSISARDPLAPRGFFDVLQVILVVSALAADAVALWAIGARIGEFGFSPNRVAALGENIILLINLAWSAVLYLRFLLGRGSFVSLERWQTGYLPIYAAWAAIVVILFPPLFR